MERSLRAIMDIRAQLASSRASQITRLQLRRLTLFQLSSFRLANLGRKLARSRSFCGKFWFVPAAVAKYCPGDPSELVGEGYGEHVLV
jgi:hypothetical protein